MTDITSKGRDRDPADLAQRLDAPGARPAPSSSHPDPSACGHFGIRIARDGTWFYHGSPITRKPLVKLFARVLRREESGDYLLVTPAEGGRIDVDDAPFTAVEATASGAGRDQVLRFRTNLDDEIEAGPDHPIFMRPSPATGETAPYIRVRDKLDALIVRSVFYHLVDLAVEERIDGQKVLGVWSGGRFFALGKPE